MRDCTWNRPFTAAMRIRVIESELRADQAAAVAEGVRQFQHDFTTFCAANASRPDMHDAPSNPAGNAAPTGTKVRRLYFPC